MVQYVQARLEEAVGVGASQQYTSSYTPPGDIQNAINDGLDELSDETEFYERYFTLTLRPRATYYDLRSVGPDSVILRVTNIWNPTRNQWLEPFTVPDLDYRTARQWELSTGDPRYWFMRGLFWLGFFPWVDSETNVLKVQYRTLHPHLVNPADTPDQLPTEYHRALANYAMYDLLSKDVETQKAMMYWQLYIEDETILAGRVGGRTSRDRTPRLGVF